MKKAVSPGPREDPQGTKTLPGEIPLWPVLGSFSLLKQMLEIIDFFRKEKIILV